VEKNEVSASYGNEMKTGVIFLEEKANFFGRDNLLHLELC
jgi:hypothetical protein